MRKSLTAVLVVCASISCWYGLSGWSAAASERFYLLVPPVFLALHTVLGTSGLRGLQRLVIPAAGFIGLLCCACAWYFMVAGSVTIPDGSGRLIRGLSPWQLCVTVYFLAGVALTVLVAWAALRWLVRHLDSILFAANVEAQKRWGRARRLLRVAMPFVILVPMLVPYLMGVMYVHRLKFPNLATPKELIGREYDDVSFVSADGLTIRGWFIPAQAPSTRTLLICHGLGVNRSHVIAYHDIGEALHANVLLFDFRGHGDSDGHTVTLGNREKLDVLAAIDYLRQRRPAEAQSIVGLGISMGSAALTRAAAEADPPLEAVILDSPFAAAVELTDNILEYVPSVVRPVLASSGVSIASLHAGCSLNEVRPIDKISLLRAPLLIIHSSGDRLIPVTHAQRMFARAAQPKSLWITDTGDHCSAWNARRQYLQRAIELIPTRLAAR